jgi:hypothetical protein
LNQTFVVLRIPSYKTPRGKQCLQQVVAEAALVSTTIAQKIGYALTGSPRNVALSGQYPFSSSCMES